MSRQAITGPAGGTASVSATSNKSSNMIATISRNRHCRRHDLVARRRHQRCKNGVRPCFRGSVQRGPRAGASRRFAVAGNATIRCAVDQRDRLAIDQRHGLDQAILPAPVSFVPASTIASSNSRTAWEAVRSRRPTGASSPAAFACKAEFRSANQRRIIPSITTAHGAAERSMADYRRVSMRCYQFHRNRAAAPAKSVNSIGPLARRRLRPRPSSSAGWSTPARTPIGKADHDAQAIFGNIQQQHWLAPIIRAGWDPA